MTNEKPNPYSRWTRQRLEKHRELIGQALVDKKKENREQVLSLDGYFNPDWFRKVHSQPECNIGLPIFLSEENVPWGDKEEQFFVKKVYEIRCTTHNVASKQFSS